MIAQNQMNDDDIIDTYRTKRPKRAISIRVIYARGVLPHKARLHPRQLNNVSTSLDSP